jgi:hypothetical protein
MKGGNNMKLKIFLSILIFLFSLKGIIYCEPSRSGIINLVYGICEVKRGEKWEKAISKFVIYQGDLIRTGEKSKAEIIFDDGSIVRIAEKTELKINTLSLNIEKKEYKTNITAKIGNLWARVKKITGYKNNFETATPTSIAGVRSTVYRMRIDEDTTTILRVYKGKVEIKTWIEAYENMIKTRAEEEIETQKTEEVYEVEGPHEVSLEEWIQIVSAMQEVVISPTGYPKKPTKFDPEEDAKDPWVSWNLQRDAQLDREGK